MKGYQKERLSVNGSIEGMDMEPLAELASEGLLALSLQVGLEVFRQTLARDVTALVGAKGRHNPDRSAYRHGTETMRMVMGGQKASVKRPRIRSKEGEELQLPTLRVFQNEDPLNRALLQRLLCGVSTRNIHGRWTDSWRMRHVPARARQAGGLRRRWKRGWTNSSSGGSKGVTRP